MLSAMADSSSDGASGPASKPIKDVADVIARAKAKKEQMQKETGAASGSAENAAPSSGDADNLPRARASSSHSEKREDDEASRKDGHDSRRSKHGSRSRSRSRERQRSKDERRSKSRERKRSTSRGREEDKERRRRSSSRDRNRDKPRDRDYDRHRDRSRDRYDRGRYDDRYERYDRPGRYDDRRGYDRGRYDGRGGGRYDDRPRYDDRRRYDDRQRDRSRDRSRDRPRDGAGREGGTGAAPAPGPSLTDLLGKVIGAPVGQAQASSGASAIPGIQSAVVPGAPIPNGAPISTAGPIDISSILARLQTATVNTSVNTMTKLARELYIGGLPQGAGLTAPALKDFFNQVMVQAGLIKPGSAPGTLPVVSARLNDQGNFAFLEMRSPEETDAAMALSGLELLGAPMKIGRPKAYTDRFGTVPSVVAVEMINKGMVNPNGPVTGVVPNAAGAAVGAPSLATLGLALGAGVNAGASGLLASMGLSSSAALFGSSSSGAAASATSAAGGPSAASSAAVSSLTLPYIPSILVSNVAPALIADAESAKDLLGQVFSQFGSLKQVMCLAPRHDGTGRMLVLYADPASLPPASLDAAISGLQGLDLAGHALRLDKPGPEHFAEAGVPVAASVNLAPAPAVSAQPAASADGPSTAGPSAASHRVLELHNIILAGSITSLPADEQEAELNDIKEDVAEECGRYGRITDVFMPPLTLAQRGAAGAGDSVPVYVVFHDAPAAAACGDKMRTKRFESRAVGVRFLSDEDFETVKAAAGAGGGDADGPASGPSHHHYGGVAVPPPPGGEAAGLPATAEAGAPEDGLTLPGGPTAADLD